MISMRSKIKYVVLITLLYSCGSNPHQKAISKMEEYNQELERFAADSTSKLDTTSINAEYYKTDMPSITTETMKEISDEASFKELLKTERDLFNQWEQIKNFKSYSGIMPDTLLKLIRRCSAFDRAPLSAERVPSARGMRAISLDYYKIEVPVAFHIIVNQRGDGQLPNMTAKIDDQIKALNSAYNKFNITFKLISTEITMNNTWFDRASYYTDINALNQMTTALSKDPARVMNVYTLGSQRVLGEATFPWYNEKGTSGDYIVINYNTLPGGPNTFFNGKYNEGKTLVHEAGHFLGLLHTFEGGDFRCDSNPPHDGCGIGDQVDDTPGQQICYFNGCDENSDSCPAPGKDPVKNFMGYNPDACMREMTQGQGERLIQSIIKFRYYLVTNPV